jgi:predicted lactoylglutathione lyase
MSKMIFVSLPVRDLAKAIAFYQALGAVNNPQFTDETSACMVLSDTIFVMLLTHDKWASFTKKPIADARMTSEVMLTLSCDSRDAVNALTEASGNAGGVTDPNPSQDYGFMFGRSFEDPDGHMWQAMWMDLNAMPARH